MPTARPGEGLCSRKREPSSSRLSEKEEAHKIFYEYPRQVLLGIDPDFAPPIRTPKKIPLLRRIFTFRKCSKALNHGIA